MKTLPTALAAHLAGRVTTLALCWVVRRRDGTFIRCTELDRDITITDSKMAGHDLEGTYLASVGIEGSDIRRNSDLAVGSMEVKGALQALPITGLTVQDVESGLLDGAVTTVFRVNYASPNDGVLIVMHGPLGEITRTSEGRYQTELRGLTQYLQTNVGRTYGERCDVRFFGDSRCKFNLTAATRTGEITVATSRRSFSFSLSGSTPASGYFDNGTVTFTSGANEGFSRSIKSATYAGGVLTVTLFEEMPADVVITDDVSVTPGCDRAWLTCRYVHNNAVNFQGYGLFTPGVAPVMRGAT